MQSSRVVPFHTTFVLHGTIFTWSQVQMAHTFQQLEATQQYLRKLKEAGTPDGTFRDRCKSFARQLSAVVAQDLSLSDPLERMRLTQALDDKLWGEEYTALLDSMNSISFSETGFRPSPAARTKQQDYAKVWQFLRADVYEDLMSSSRHLREKIEKLSVFTRELGLRNPSEGTFCTLTAIIVKVTLGDKAFETKPSELFEYLGVVKDGFKKTRGAVSPNALEPFLVLPEIQEFRDKHSEMYGKVFFNGPPVTFPDSLQFLSLLNRIPIRKTRTSVRNAASERNLAEVYKTAMETMQAQQMRFFQSMMGGSSGSNERGIPINFLQPPPACAASSAGRIGFGRSESRELLPLPPPPAPPPHAPLSPPKEDESNAEAGGSMLQIEDAAPRPSLHPSSAAKCVPRPSLHPSSAAKRVADALDQLGSKKKAKASSATETLAESSDDVSDPGELDKSDDVSKGGKGKTTSAKTTKSAKHKVKAKGVGKAGTGRGRGRPSKGVKGKPAAETPKKKTTAHWSYEWSRDQVVARTPRPDGSGFFCKIFKFVGGDHKKAEKLATAWIRKQTA